MYPLWSLVNPCLEPILPKTRICITCENTLPLSKFPRNECLRPFWMDLPSTFKHRCGAHDEWFEQKNILQLSERNFERQIGIPKTYDIWKKQKNKCNECGKYLLNMNYRTMHSAYSPLYQENYDPVLLGEKKSGERELIHYECSKKNQEMAIIQGKEQIQLKREIDDFKQKCIALRMTLEKTAENTAISEEKKKELTDALKPLVDCCHTKMSKYLGGPSFKRMKTSDAKLRKELKEFCAKPRDVNPRWNADQLVKCAFDRARSYLTGIELVSMEEAESKIFEQKEKCTYCQESLDSSACLDPIKISPLGLPLYQNFVVAHESCSIYQFLPNLLSLYQAEFNQLTLAVVECQKDPQSYVNSMIQNYIKAWKSQYNYLKKSIAKGNQYNFDQSTNLNESKSIVESVKQIMYIDLKDESVFASYNLFLLSKDCLGSISKKRKPQQEEEKIEKKRKQDVQS